MSEKEILYDVKDYVATITINRPKTLNAFTGDNIVEMERLILEATADKKVGVIVLTGSGVVPSGIVPSGMDPSGIAPPAKPAPFPLGTLVRVVPNEVPRSNPAFFGAEGRITDLFAPNSGPIYFVVFNDGRGDAFYREELTVIPDATS